MKNFLRASVLFAGLTGLFVFAQHARAATAASAQGPQFIGPPSVPSLQFRTSNQITTCVGDGGFTQCSNSPQSVSVAAVQAVVNPQNNTILFNLDGGSGNQAVLTGQAANPTDGGAYLPGLSASTVVICDLVQPVPTGTTASGGSCSAVTQAPGGDGGVVLVTCTMANLGTDGGQVSCIRLN